MRMLPSLGPGNWPGREAACVDAGKYCIANEVGGEGPIGLSPVQTLDSCGSAPKSADAPEKLDCGGHAAPEVEFTWLRPQSVSIPGDSARGTEMDESCVSVGAYAVSGWVM